MMDDPVCTAEHLAAILESATAVSFPSAAEAVLAYSAGFTLILAPWLIAWSATTIARTIRAFN